MLQIIIILETIIADKAYRVTHFIIARVCPLIEDLSYFSNISKAAIWIYLKFGKYFGSMVSHNLMLTVINCVNQKRRSMGVVTLF